MIKTIERGRAKAERRLFPEGTWHAISGDVARAFGLDQAETEAIQGNMFARLIAALPFLAGCEDAERTAVAHLGTYILSTRQTKRYFNATARDSATILERLWLIADFRGGDRAIIERGMNLLALNMISDYRRDIEEDSILDKYNPLAAGDFDYEETAAGLRRSIQAVDCPEMDRIAPLRAVPMAWWLA